MPNPLRVAAPTCAALVLLTGVASAAPLSGAVDDPPGDVKTPEQDIVAGAVAYDPAGIVRGAVTTAAAATAQATAVVDVMLGKASRATGRCDIDFYGSMYPDDEGVFGGLRAGGRRLAAPAVFQNGQVMQIDSSAGPDGEPANGPLPALAGKPWDCGVVATFSTKEVRGDYADADDTGVFPLTTGAAAVSPICRVASEKARRGGRLGISCVGVTGAVTVRMHTKKPRSSATAQLAPDGSASVRVRRKLRRGWYIAAVWQGKALMGSGSVRVR